MISLDDLIQLIAIALEINPSLLDENTTAESVESWDSIGHIIILSHLEDLIPGGLLIIGVPGREDRWYLEDDLVGHLRRYSKNRLRTVIEEQTNSETEVWSIGYPLMNIGQRVKNILLKKQATQF